MENSISEQHEPDQPILVEVRRGEIVESWHRGCIAAVEPDGKLVTGVGDVSVVTYMRSTAKPIQALPLIVSGAAERFNFTSAELALMAASHSGEPIHTEVAASILNKIHLDKSYLHCGVHLPFAKSVQVELAGRQPDVLQNNCSGKHSGMLAQCVASGVDTHTYESPENPVQREIRRTLALLAGLETGSIGVAIDGCSAPVFAMPVLNMAQAYAQLVNPTELSDQLKGACHRIVEAMLDHPELVAGTTDRVCTDIMRVCGRSVIAKVGAEGVYTMGVLPNDRYPRGLGIAIKIEDGNDRATAPAAIETLDQLQLLSAEQRDQLSSWRNRLIKNHRGTVTGSLRPVFHLSGL